MKSNLLFNIGLGIDTLLLLLMLSNLVAMYNLPFDEHARVLTRWVLLGLPALLLLLVGLAYWLKSSGKMTAANILVWIPALPAALVFVIWGGLAVLFILAGK